MGYIILNFSPFASIRYFITAKMYVPYKRMSRLRRERTVAPTEMDHFDLEGPDVSDTEADEYEEKIVFHDSDLPGTNLLDSDHESSDSDSELYTGVNELLVGAVPLYVSPLRLM